MNGERMPAPHSPMACARVLAAEYIHDDRPTLRHWRGSWIEWNGSRWAELETAAIRAQLYKRLEGCHYLDKDGKAVGWLPNKPKVANLLEAMAAVLYLPDTINPPMWMTTVAGDPTGPSVACANGILDVQTRTLHQPTPRYFNTVAVPFDYQPTPPEPTRWLEFLHDLWPEDPEAIACLQEWFGYVLSGRTDLHKMLLVVGPTRSGKGTISRILTRLVGTVAAPTLLALGGDFGMAALIGKGLCIIPDARIDKRSSQVVVERLLSISGEDTVEINRKYRDPWTGKLGARVMILSNELPELVDESGAVGNRFIVLSMMNSFLGRENTRLLDELEEELPAILNWSLDGLSRLTIRGRLTAPSSAADAIRTMSDLVSPVSVFLRDECQTGPDYQAPVDEVWSRWKKWCEENSVGHGTKQSFGKKLNSARPSVRVIRPRNGWTGDRVRVYDGLGIRGSADHEDSPRTTSADQAGSVLEQNDEWSAHSADRSADGPQSEIDIFAGQDPLVRTGPHRSSETRSHAREGNSHITLSRDFDPSARTTSDVCPSCSELEPGHLPGCPEVQA